MSYVEKHLIEERRLLQNGLHGSARRACSARLADRFAGAGIACALLGRRQFNSVTPNP